MSLFTPEQLGHDPEAEGADTLGANQTCPAALGDLDRAARIALDPTQPDERRKACARTLSAIFGRHKLNPALAGLLERE